MLFGAATTAVEVGDDAGKPFVVAAVVVGVVWGLVGMICCSFWGLTRTGGNGRALEEGLSASVSLLLTFSGEGVSLLFRAAMSESKMRLCGKMSALKLKPQIKFPTTLFCFCVMVYYILHV